MKVLGRLFVRRKIVNYETLLIFIGSPRTGSTILGQLLNYHPQCLIATESRLITKVVCQGYSFDKALLNLQKSALSQFYTGLENDRKYGKTLGIYQKKWVPMSELAKNPLFQKKKIKVLGDKKAGGVTAAYLEQPKGVESFLLSNRGCRLIQIIRNPVAAAVSYINSHGLKKFEEACNEIIIKTNIAYRIGKSIKIPFYFLYYEDLQQNPKRELSKVLTWLDLETRDEWLEKIASVVSRTTNEKYGPAQIVQSTKLIKMNRAEDVFGRYLG